MNTYLSKKPPMKAPMKKSFVDLPAPPERESSEDMAQVYSLVTQGNFGAVIDFLLEKSIDLNLSFDGKIIFNEVINIPNEKTSQDKKIEFLTYLIDIRKVFINSYDEHGNTPLHCAVKHGYEKIVTFLLDHNININSQTENNLTPLHYATLITLKDCPKENLPLNLIEKDRNKKTKTKDITKKIIATILKKGQDINVDGGDIESLYTKFTENTVLMSNIYKILIKDAVDNLDIDKEIKNIYKTDTVSQNKLIEKLVDASIKQLKGSIAFPENIVNSIDELKVDVVNYSNPFDRMTLYYKKMEEIKKAIMTNVLEKNLKNNIMPSIFTSTELLYKRKYEEVLPLLHKYINKYDIPYKESDIKQIVYQNIISTLNITPIRELYTLYPGSKVKFGDDMVETLLNTIDNVARTDNDLYKFADINDISGNGLNEYFISTNPDPNDKTFVDISDNIGNPKQQFSLVINLAYYDMNDGMVNAAQNEANDANKIIPNPLLSANFNHNWLSDQVSRVTDGVDTFNSLKTLNYPYLIKYMASILPWTTINEQIRNLVIELFAMSKRNDNYILGFKKSSIQFIEQANLTMKALSSMARHLKVDDFDFIITNLGKSLEHIHYISALSKLIDNPQEITLPYADHTIMTYTREQNGTIERQIISIEDLYNENVLKNMHIAMRYKHLQSKQVNDYMKTHFSAGMSAKTYCIKICLGHGITNCKSIIESKVENIYNTMIIMLEQFAYNKLLPFFAIAPTNFTVDSKYNVSDNLLLHMYANEKITGIDINQHLNKDNGNDSINAFYDTLITGRKRNYLPSFLEQLDNNWLLKIKKDAANASLTDYDLLNDNFTKDFANVDNKKVEHCEKIVATFYAFLLTFFKRYFFDNVHYGNRADIVDFTGAVVLPNDIDELIFRTVQKVVEKHNFTDAIREPREPITDKNHYVNYMIAYDRIMVAVIPGVNPRNQIQASVHDMSDNHFRTNANLNGNPDNATTYLWIDEFMDKALDLVVNMDRSGIYDKEFVKHMLRNVNKHMANKNSYERVLHNIIDRPDAVPIGPFNRWNTTYVPKEYHKLVTDPLIKALKNIMNVGDIIEIKDQALITPVNNKIYGRGYNTVVNTYYESLFSYYNNEKAFVGLNNAAIAPIAVDGAIASPLIKAPIFNDMKTLTLTIANIAQSQHNILLTGNINIDPDEIKNYNLIIALMLRFKNQIQHLQTVTLDTTMLTTYKNCYKMYHHCALIAKLFELLNVSKSKVYYDLMKIEIDVVSKGLKDVADTLVANDNNKVYYQNAIETILNIRRNITKTIFKVLNTHSVKYYKNLKIFNKISSQIIPMKKIHSLAQFDFALRDKLKVGKKISITLQDNNMYKLGELDITNTSKELTGVRNIVIESSPGLDVILNLHEFVKNLTTNPNSLDNRMANNQILRDAITANPQLRDQYVAQYAAQYVNIINRNSNTVRNSSKHDAFAEIMKIIEDNKDKEFVSKYGEDITTIITQHMKLYMQQMYLYVYSSQNVLTDYLPHDGMTLATEPIKMLDIIDNQLMKQIVANHYNNTIAKYKLRNTNYGTLDLSIDKKENVINNHMHNIYEQFFIKHMTKQIQFLFTAAIKQKLTGKQINMNGINAVQSFTPDDYVIDLNVKSELKNHLIDGHVIENENHHTNVKLIEDENYDIVTIQDNVIKESGKDTYVFYSYDYYNKQNDMKCIEINTNIIEELIKHNANIYAIDINNKTIIDYMIEGRMYYLLKTSTVRQACSLYNSIITLTNYEERHNSLFIKQNNNVITYPLMDNHQSDFINKLKQTENIKLNIPINIKYIFLVFTVFQNIHWYRMMNKEFHNNDDYNDKYIEYENNAIGPGQRIIQKYDWKQYFNIPIETETILAKEKAKIQKQLERNDKLEIYNRDRTFSDVQKEVLNALKDDKIGVSGENVNLDVFNHDHINKLFTYFTDLFEKYNDVPTNYTYIWKELDKNIMEKDFIIHRVLMSKYNYHITNVKNSEHKSNLMSGRKTTLDKEKVNSLIKECKVLDTLLDPISKYIDDRVLPYIYDDNRLLQFQVSTIIHILSSFLGSNIYMLYKRIIEADMKESSVPVTDALLDDVLKDLKKYVLSNDDKSGNLSYDFVKAHMQFLDNDEDNDEIELANTLFVKLPDMLLSIDNYNVKSNSIFEKLKSSVANYYLALYIETTNALLNFSDGYYRLTKNQLLGIKFTSLINQVN